MMATDTQLAIGHDIYFENYVYFADGINKSKYKIKSPHPRYIRFGNGCVDGSDNPAGPFEKLEV